MRALYCALLLLFAGPASAADWGHYVNERFGVAIDVPPGFVAQPPPANGDGLGFRSPTAELNVFGSLANIDLSSFEAEMAQRIQWSGDDGWAITYRSVTPSWAVFSGEKGGRVLYARALSMCNHDILGMYQLEYSRADMAKMDAVIARLNASFGDSGTGWQCK